MVNIVVKVPNIVLQRGIMNLLHDIIIKEHKTTVSFLPFERCRSARVDIAVISLQPWQLSMWLTEVHPLKQCVYVCLLDGQDEKHQGRLICCDGLIVIKKKHGLSVIREKIKKVIGKLGGNKKYYCAKCDIKKLTKQEFLVSKMLVEGNNIEEVALGLNISKYTVQAHVRNVMLKYKLHSKHELIFFLSKYLSKLHDGRILQIS